MTVFIDIILETIEGVDCLALQKSIVSTFGLGAHVEHGRQIPLTKYLGAVDSPTRLVVSLYDSPQTNVAEILGSELDWTPEAEITLPLKVLDRVNLLLNTLHLIAKTKGTSLYALGISDGDYFYQKEIIHLSDLKDRIKLDIDNDEFLGKVYIFK